MGTFHPHNPPHTTREPIVLVDDDEPKCCANIEFHLGSIQTQSLCGHSDHVDRDITPASNV